MRFNCTTNNYTVGGNVTGLVGSIVLRRTVGTTVTDVTVTDGTSPAPFTFAAQASGTAYTVTVNSRVWHCTDLHAEQCFGAFTTANVTNIGISCSTTAYSVGGSVAGLLGGNSVVLQNNAGNNTTVSANGPFTFSTQVASGAGYAVTVLTNPASPAQTCTATNASGTVSTAAITNVSITCVNVDVTAPTVTGTTPVNTTVGTSLQTAVLASFSEAVKTSTATSANFTLKGPDGVSLPGTITLENSNQRLRFVPTALLKFDTTYTATLTTGITDPSGDALATNIVWTFNTGHKVAVGGFHTCARLDGTDNGIVKCWGSNAYGQLGAGNTNNLGDGAGEMGVALPPVFLGAGRTVVDITAGQNYTCARLDDGSVKCWGLNDEGQLGLGTTNNMGDGPNEMADNLLPVNVGTTVLQVVLAACIPAPA